MSLRFVATRLGMLVVTVLASSLAIYGAMFLTPGTPPRCSSAAAGIPTPPYWHRSTASTTWTIRSSRATGTG